MDESYNRLSPEFALVQILDTVPVLKDSNGEAKAAALQPKKEWRPPFVFYIPIAENEETALDGQTGLQSFTVQLHCVAGTFRGLQRLCMRIKRALQESPGTVYSTPEEDTEYGVRGRILVEDLRVDQNSPDLYEAEVGYYRRLYTVRMEFQTEEVYDNAD